jgi:citrate lyase subunit beta / citryl-CoA lyase
VRESLRPKDKVAQAVSALFVPGDQPDRFNKAYMSGADLVIIDLEDGVQDSNKDAALEHALQGLANKSGHRLEAIVRVNKERLDIELTRLLSLSQAEGNGLLGIMFPKVEAASDIPGNLGVLAVVSLVETSKGIENLSDLTQAKNLTRLAFGGVDFSAETGATHPAVLNYARSRIVTSSIAAGLPQPLDSPSLTLKDEQVVLESALEGYQFGFGGKLAVHPNQISAIHKGFSPSSEEIDWANQVLAQSKGAVQLSGQMVDKPIYERAKKVIALSKRLN